MNKKFLILLLMTLFLSGCKVEYTLEIDDVFKDDMHIFINPEDKINKEDDEELMGNRLLAIMEKGVYSYFEDYSASYNKDLIQKSGYEILKLNYSFNNSDYKKANVVRSCFQNVDIDTKSDEYIFDLNGYFYCLYNNEQIKINVKTDYDVLENNASMKNGNIYSWVINRNNYTDVNIKFKIKKETEVIGDNTNDKLVNIIIIVTIILSLVASLFVFIKVKNSNK